MQVESAHIKGYRLFENETIFLLDNNTEKVYEIPLSKLKKSNLIYEMPGNILESEEE